MVRKADGPGAWDRTLLVDENGARRVPVHVVHDLPHLVVESVFGLGDGLWAELARGEHGEAARAAGARNSRRRKIGRIVSGAATGQPTTVWLSEGHRRAKAFTNAVVNHWKDGPDSPAGVRARLHKEADQTYEKLLRTLDDATIQLAIDGVRWIYQQWAHTEPGHSLHLTWPLPPAFHHPAQDDLLGAAPGLQRLRADHAQPILAFELANRAYFATSITDRGDDYFEEFTERYDALLTDQASGKAAYYVLVADDGSVIGRFNLTFVGDDTAELGYRVAENVAGRGVATAAVRDVCRLASEQHGVRVIRAATTEANLASQRVLLKSGFTPVGPADPADIGGKAGSWYERVVTAVTGR